MIAVRLPKEIEQRLTRLATKTGRTKSYYVREALITHLDNLEDKYTALERLEHPTKTWTLEALEQNLDLNSHE